MMGEDLAMVSFNPTMVRLLPFLQGADNADNPTSFNPTMVRLLPAERQQVCLAHPWFQSHNGAIAA